MFVPIMAALIGLVMMSLVLLVVMRRARGSEERLITDLRKALQASNQTIDDEVLDAAITATVPIWQNFVRDMALDGHALTPPVGHRLLVLAIIEVYRGAQPMPALQAAWQQMQR